MRNVKGSLLSASLTVAVLALLGPAASNAQAPAAAPAHNMANMKMSPVTGANVKVTDPTSVVMIVDRDSNDIAFMDIKTREIIGRTFLGQNVNPHMVMMSPDGRYVVTGGNARTPRTSSTPTRSSSSPRSPSGLRPSTSRSRRTAAGTTKAIPRVTRSP